MSKIRILVASLLIFCLVTFITLLIVIGVSDCVVLPVDAAVRDFAYSIRGEKYGWFYYVTRFLTDFGDIYVAVLLVLIVGVLTKADYRFFLFGIGIFLSGRFNSFVKNIYDRPRPFEDFRWQEYNSLTSFSFPSGHSNAAGFLYTYLFYLIYKLDNIKPALRKTGLIACAVMIPLIMFTRLIIGVHYFTDVLAGATGGILIALLFVYLSELCKKKNILTTGLWTIVYNKVKKS